MHVAAQGLSVSVEDSTMMISRFEKIQPQLKVNNIVVDEKILFGWPPMMG